MKSIQWKFVIIFSWVFLGIFGVHAVFGGETFHRRPAKDTQPGAAHSLLAEHICSPAGFCRTTATDQAVAIWWAGKFTCWTKPGLWWSPAGAEADEGRKSSSRVVLLSGDADSSIRFDPHTGHRVYYHSEPIYQLNSLVGEKYLRLAAEHRSRLKHHAQYPAHRGGVDPALVCHPGA